MTNEQTIDAIMGQADDYARAYAWRAEEKAALRNMVTAALAANAAEIERLTRECADLREDCANLKDAMRDDGDAYRAEIAALKAQLAEPASPEPGEWIEWRGGRSPPIPDGILHQARLRNGAELNENSRASAVAWDHQCSARDIIAYRIIS